MLIPSQEEVLAKAIEMLWMSSHGPPKELITDSESGIVFSRRATEYIARRGAKLHPRGEDRRA
eukprot:11215532-Lingulodinium_polyedra.AAC.1